MLILLFNYRHLLKGQCAVSVCFFDIEESKVGLLRKDGGKMLTQRLLVICWTLPAEWKLSDAKDGECRCR